MIVRSHTRSPAKTATEREVRYTHVKGTQLPYVSGRTILVEESLPDGLADERGSILLGRRPADHKERAPWRIE